MVLNTNNNPNTYDLKVISIGTFLIFILIFAALNSSNYYSLKTGFAISQKRHHNSNSVNIFNADNPTLSSHKSTKTKKTGSSSSSSHHHHNLSPPNTGKLVILTFGDTLKSQFTTAKPILDQYGFKASFFITCSFPDDGGNNGDKINRDNSNNNGNPHMSWNDILALQQDGQDIESKGMTHQDLNQLSQNDLEYEIGGSKQCLENHGINSPNIFAAVHGDAWSNPTVINTISKYYGFADNGFADLIFLHCDGSKSGSQTDCRTFDDNGALTYANRFSIREDSHNSWDQKYLHNDPILFQKFVAQVNSQTAYNNKKGFTDAIPIVAYHSIDDSKGPSSTDVNLFASEMKYLYDNGFRVIPMSDLRYDQITNYMYIRNNQLNAHPLSS
jgi:peptidoglycan/xylan/chitin deacetylase (PgdA/CDA1 family)